MEQTVAAAVPAMVGHRRGLEEARERHTVVGQSERERERERGERTHGEWW